MPLSLLTGLLLTGVTLAGLAWPLAARLSLSPLEKIGASVMLSLLGVWLAGWIIFVFSLPRALCWALPVLAALGLATGARQLIQLGREPAVRGLLVAQLLVTAWCLAWLALVRNYSGGLWAFDWFEHWERTRFFLEHWPRDTVFLNQYAVTARPPFINVVAGVLLQFSRAGFAHYQVIMTLLGSLAFLPAALLAHRFGSSRAVALLTVLVMLNPLFVQNSVYPWTKLPAAFFVLLALVFFLRSREEPVPGAAPVLFGLSLAAGLLAHYSAAPYALLLGAGWFFPRGEPGRRTTAFRRATVMAAASSGVVLVIWFGWALAVYGPAATFLGNSTVSEQAPTLGAQAGRILLNLRDTLVPHFLRTVDSSLLQQASTWGWWRDWFFQLYQLNLLFAFGCAGWMVLLWKIGRAARSSSPETRLWLVLAVAAVLLGVGVHGARDTWGLTHICLQSLVLLGLVFLAAHWPDTSSVWRWILSAGLAVDLVAGIGLNFFVQGGWTEHGLARPAAVPEMLQHYTQTATANLQLKLQTHLDFLGDIFTSPPVLVLALLGAILTLALTRTVHAHAQDHDRHPDIQ